jgi:serine/threonine protein phosphatase 1
MKWNSWLGQATRVAPRAPDGLRIYAIGDIHGRADLLAALLREIEIDRKVHAPDRSVTVFLGDYIDRGPASRDVIDLLLDHGRTNSAVFLKGNHETYIRRFLDDPTILDEWRLCGGLETLCSYGLAPSVAPSRPEQRQLSREFARLIPAQHLQFIASLDKMFWCGDFLFVHAGIRPGVSLRNQKEEDLLWIRDEFLSSESRFEKFVVHGHTPVEAMDIHANRINIDTGAFATGRLTCIAIEGTSIVPVIAARDWAGARSAKADASFSARTRAVY